ncbi:MAG TPA: transporter, partial [Kocuria sp.]|nr:transporter [Kocuria sp.]
MSIVENAIYRNGRKVETPRSLEETYTLLKRAIDRSEGDEHGSGTVLAWIGLYRPTPEEIRSLAEHFQLHELAVEDTIQAHQRPKMERYGQTLFTVIRP